MSEFLRQEVVKLAIRVELGIYRALGSSSEDVSPSEDFALSLQLQELDLAGISLPKNLTDDIYKIGSESGFGDDDDALETPKNDVDHGSKKSLDPNDRYAFYCQMQQVIDADHQCTGCGDLFSAIQASRAPCSHVWCFECMANFFESAMRDEALYPPRCCGQEVSFEIAKFLFSAKFIKRYEQKQIEYDTAAANRTYCSGSNCGKFIPNTGGSNEVATCSDCGKRTCTICKARAHRGDCPRDEATQGVLRLAENMGWRRCCNTSCLRMIERSAGCNHMTCKCGAQFCYLCGAPWKTCSCRQMNWGEN